MSYFLILLFLIFDILISLVLVFPCSSAKALVMFWILPIIVIKSPEVNFVSPEGIVTRVPVLIETILTPSFEKTRFFNGLSIHVSLLTSVEPIA